MSILAVIRGLGLHVPEKVLTNKDFEEMVETSDEWITSRTGIKERHVAAADEGTSDMVLPAALNALADAGMSAEQLTHLIVPTITPDMPCPSVACVVAERLGLRGRVAFDINAACSGFVYSLQVARGLVQVHDGATILLAAADVLTSRTNFQDRATCVLFGDGCGAAVVTADDGGQYLAGIRDVMLASDGGCRDLLTIKGGGSKYRYAQGETPGEEYFIQMKGREVFKHAVRNMESLSREILERNGLGMDDIDLFIPHQANLRIIEGLAKKLDVSLDKVFINVDRYGNTSAASVPIALAEAKNTGRIKPGYRVLLATFGAGFTWGTSILEF